jgi:hypothetical protein
MPIRRLKILRDMMKSKAQLRPKYLFVEQQPLDSGIRCVGDDLSYLVTWLCSERDTDTLHD